MMVSISVAGAKAACQYGYAWVAGILCGLDCSALLEEIILPFE